MKRLVVIDTEDGTNIPDWYRDALPHCTFHGDAPSATLGKPTHPHGMMVAGQAALRTYPEETEVTFLRVFDENAKAISNNWYFDFLSGTGPYMDFGAGGNSDENDRDEDVDFPQRVMGLSNVIGSCNKRGIPSFFSGDGPRIQCVAVGERIWLHDKVGWSLASGTSFSTPKVAGICAMEMEVPVVIRSWGSADMDMIPESNLAATWQDWIHNYSEAIGSTGKEDAWDEYVREYVTVPRGWMKGERHDKWGFGSLENRWQHHVREDVPTELHPPTGPTTGTRIKYLDMREFK